MKIYQFLIFTTLVIYIHNECTTSINIYKYRDCSSRALSVVEKLLGYAHCCYISGVSENEEIKRCIPITQYNLHNIEEAIKYYEQIYRINATSFTC